MYYKNVHKGVLYNQRVSYYIQYINLSHISCIAIIKFSNSMHLQQQKKTKIDDCSKFSNIIKKLKHTKDHCLVDSRTKTKHT